MKLSIIIIAIIGWAGLFSVTVASSSRHIIPATYIGPDSTNERESFMIACLSATDPSMLFKANKDIIETCHAVSVTLYGVAGFVYINRSGDKISIIKPCIKAGSPAEKKVCGD